MIIDKNSGQIQNNIFSDIESKLWKNDVLVLNQTRVINARLKGYLYNLSSHWLDDTRKWNQQKTVEIFLHKQISSNSWDCLVYPWKKLKPWTKVFFNSPSPWEDGVNVWDLIATIKSISESWRIVEFNKWSTDFLEAIENIGETPLPPYIKEKLENSDRYQTVYNKISWSVAAPTAWLHFTKKLLNKLIKKWVKVEKVLLHVWLWTFKNVEIDDIKKHKMHSEYIELEKEVSKRLNSYKKDWKRIISVWTTSTRVLESFSNRNWVLGYWKKETDIFIYPWYKWKFIDNLITNFHLPKSTLLMLVSSLAWNDIIKKAYSKAVDEKYRFFSFWDAMWIR
jgi:S-adenosylmethionine:tRNA ribosyltransferase-isomerase